MAAMAAALAGASCAVAQPPRPEAPREAPTAAQAAGPGRPRGEDHARKVAITFDDLPGVHLRPTLAALRDMNERLVAALAEARVPAAGFVNEDKLDVEGERADRRALLASWLDAGLTLGNHTHSHISLTRRPIEECERDTLRGEAATRALMRERGLDLTWFRYPYSQTGPTQAAKERFEAFLKRHGYRVASFTAHNNDYIFARLHDRALDEGDVDLARRIERAYLDHLDEMLTWFEGLAREAFGRDIAQILLLHVNDLNAETIRAILERLAWRGYRPVTLEEALEDPAYATPDDYVGPNGPSWLHRWRVAQGLPSRQRTEPDPPAWIMEEWGRIPPGLR